MAHWIEASPRGIHVLPADAWIDPAVPVERALITHGHADHARGGHGTSWATPETLAIMALRYGPGRGVPVGYGETIRLGGVAISYRPAGHVLGSAQILLEHAGERIVVTGDYKRRHDPTCAPFEAVPCDVLITEATFGLPVFRHPPIDQEIDRLLAALHAAPDRCVLVGAYALGKAQRLIAELRARGHADPIHVHGALERMCDLYRDCGVELGELRPATAAGRDELRGTIVLCPPSALNDRWSRRLPDPITAMASGWMRVRQRARQRQVELPLVISDHADWDELNATIDEVGAPEVWVTHGREEALIHAAETRGIKGRALRLVGYGEEDEAEDVVEAAPAGC